MCGRSQFLRVPEVVEAFGPARVGDVADVSEEAFPGSVVPAVVVHGTERVVSSFRWGFFEDDTGHNARLETATTRPAWRDAYATARLVMPVAAFVEGRAWFRPEAGGALAVAGLYRFGRDRRRRATMLTRPAGEAVAPFHERMPVVLPGELMDAWLAGADVPVEELVTRSVALSVEPFRPPSTAQPQLFGDGD
jgi:putative SOS response-associated peptidase YedK